MESKVGGTNVGQKWRVSGFRAGDRPHLEGGDVALVGLEFWIEMQPDEGPTTYKYLLPSTMDPVLARELGQHLIEMANHAEGLGYE
jgi:hypothetical protein